MAAKGCGTPAKSFDADAEAASNKHFFDVMSVHLYSRSSNAYDVVSSIRSGMSVYPRSCTRLVKVFDKKADKAGKRKKGVACPRVFNIAQTDPVVAQAPAAAPAVAEVAAPF